MSDSWTAVSKKKPKQGGRGGGAQRGRGRGRGSGAARGGGGKDSFRGHSSKPKRGGGGGGGGRGGHDFVHPKSGRATVITNHFNVTEQEEDPKIFYDVFISVEPPRENVSRVVQKAAKQLLGDEEFARNWRSFNGKDRAFLAQPLDDSIEIVDGSDMLTVTFRSGEGRSLLEHAADKDKDYLSNAALRSAFGDRGASTNETVIKGNVIVHKPKKELDRYVTEIWRGHSQALVPTDIGAAVQIDYAVAVVSKEMPLTDYIRMKKLPLNDARKCGRELRGIRVRLSHFKDKDGNRFERKKTIYRVSDKSAAELTFDGDDGKQVSVVDYYASKYGITLTRPQWPCVDTSKEGGTFFPIELCTVLAGCVRKNLGREERDRVMNAACVTPQERLDESRKAAQQLAAHASAELGVNVDVRPIAVEADVLEPASVHFAKTSKNKVERGAVKWNLRDRKLETSHASVDSFAIFYVYASKPDKRICGNLEQQFVAEFVKYQLRFRHAKASAFTQAKQAKPSELAAQLGAFLDQNAPVALVFLVVPDDDTQRYVRLKHEADRRSIVSQCVLESNVLGRSGSPSPQLVGNLALKVNMKLGGQNWSAHDAESGAPIDYKTTMLCGMDVHHQGTGDLGADVGADTMSIANTVVDTDKVPHTSVVALTASDATGAYYASVVAVPRGQEVYTDVEAMFDDRLEQFLSTSDGRMPAHILFLRDGVGLNQFEAVVSEEIAGLRRAIERRCGADSAKVPLLTYIVCTKRHHTRLFLKVGGTDVEPQVINCDAGTLVSDGITYAKELRESVLPDTEWRDFYLLSHMPLKGTSSPSHYHVLIDERFGAGKQLESTLYTLCFDFQRATLSVSMPSPLMHAHLAAYRARYALRKESERKKMSEIFKQMKMFWM